MHPKVTKNQKNEETTTAQHHILSSANSYHPKQQQQQPQNNSGTNHTSNSRKRMERRGSLGKIIESTSGIFKNSSSNLNNNSNSMTSNNNNNGGGGGGGLVSTPSRRISILTRDAPEVQDLKKELADLKKQLSDRERVNRLLVKENDSLQSHNSELRLENDLASNEMQDLNEELDDMHEELRDLKQEVKALEKERDELEDHYHYKAKASTGSSTRHLQSRSSEEQHRLTPEAGTTGMHGGDCQSVISQVSHGTVLSGNGSVASQEDAGLANGGALSPSSHHHQQTFNADNQHEHYKFQMKHRLSLAHNEKAQIHKELDRIRKERDDLIELLMKSQSEKKYLVKRVNKASYQANHFEWLAREIQDMSEEATHFVHSTLRESYEKCDAQYNDGEQPHKRHHPRMCYSCNRPYITDNSHLLLNHNNNNTSDRSNNCPSSPPPQTNNISRMDLNKSRTNNKNSPRLPGQEETIRARPPLSKAEEILSNFNDAFVPVPLPPPVPSISSLIQNPPMPPKEKHRQRSRQHTDALNLPPPPPPNDYDADQDDGNFTNNNYENEAVNKFASRFSVLAKPRAIGARSTSLVLQKIASSPRANSLFSRASAAGNNIGQSVRQVTTGSMPMPSHNNSTHSTASASGARGGGMSGRSKSGSIPSSTSMTDLHGGTHVTPAAPRGRSSSVSRLESANDKKQLSPTGAASSRNNGMTSLPQRGSRVAPAPKPTKQSHNSQGRSRSGNGSNLVSQGLTRQHPPTLMEGISFRQEKDMDDESEDDEVTLLEPFQPHRSCSEVYNQTNIDMNQVNVNNLPMNLSYAPFPKGNMIQSAPTSRRNSINSNCLSIAEES